MPSEIVLPLKTPTSKQEQSENQKVAFQRFLQEVYGTDAAEQDSLQFLRLIKKYSTFVESKAWFDNDPNDRNSKLNLFRESLDSFKSKVTAGNKLALNTKAPFEKICFHLMQNDEIDEETKKQCVLDLILPLKDCVEGAQGQLQSKLMSLDAATIPQHLAFFLQSMIEETALKRLLNDPINVQRRANGYDDLEGINTRNKYPMKAYNMGITIIGKQPFDQWQGFYSDQVISKDIRTLIDRDYNLTSFLDYLNSTAASFIVNLEFSIKSPEDIDKKLPKLLDFMHNFGLNNEDVITALNFKFKMNYLEMSELLSEMIKDNVKFTYSTDPNFGKNLEKSSSDGLTHIHIINANDTISFVTKSGKHEIISIQTDPELYEKLTALAEKYDKIRTETPDNEEPLELALISNEIAELISSADFREFNTEFFSHILLQKMFKDGLLFYNEAGEPLSHSIGKAQSVAKVSDVKILSSGRTITCKIFPAYKSTTQQDTIILLQVDGKFLSLADGLKEPTVRQHIVQYFDDILKQQSMSQKITTLLSLKQSVQITEFKNLAAEALFKHLLKVKNDAQHKHELEVIKSELIRSQLKKGAGNIYYDFVINQLIPVIPHDQALKLFFTPPENNQEIAINNVIMHRYMNLISQEPRNSDFGWFKNRGYLLDDWLKNITSDSLEKFINGLESTPERPERRILSTNSVFKQFIVDENAPEFTRLQRTRVFKAQVQYLHDFFVAESSGKSMAYNDELLNWCIQSFSEKDQTAILPNLVKNSNPTILRWLLDPSKKDIIKQLLVKIVMTTNIKDAIAFFKQSTIVEMIKSNKDSVIKEYFFENIFGILAAEDLKLFILPSENRNPDKIKVNDEIMQRIYDAYKSMPDKQEELVALFTEHPAIADRFIKKPNVLKDMYLIANASDILATINPTEPVPEVQRLLRLLQLDPLLDQIALPDPSDNYIRVIFTRYFESFSATMLCGFLTNNHDDLAPEDRLTSNRNLIRTIFDERRKIPLTIGKEDPTKLFNYIVKNASYLQQEDLLDKLVEYTLKSLSQSTSISSSQAVSFLEILMASREVIQAIAKPENHEIRHAHHRLFSQATLNDKARLYLPDYPEFEDYNNMLGIIAIANPDWGDHATSLGQLVERNQVHILSLISVADHDTLEILKAALRVNIKLGKMFYLPAFREAISSGNQKVIDLFKVASIRFDEWKEYDKLLLKTQQLSKGEAASNLLIIKTLLANTSKKRIVGEEDAFNYILGLRDEEIIEILDNEEMINGLALIAALSRSYKPIENLLLHPKIIEIISKKSENFLTRFFIESMHNNQIEISFLDRFMTNDGNKNYKHLNAQILKHMFESCMKDSSLSFYDTLEQFTKHPEEFKELIKDEANGINLLDFAPKETNSPDKTANNSDEIIAQKIQSLLMIEPAKELLHEQSNNQLKVAFDRFYRLFSAHVLIDLLVSHTSEQNIAFNNKILDQLIALDPSEHKNLDAKPLKLISFITVNKELLQKDDRLTKLVTFIVKSKDSYYSHTPREVIEFMASPIVTDLIIDNKSADLDAAYFKRLSEFSPETILSFILPNDERNRQFNNKVLATAINVHFKAIDTLSTASFKSLNESIISFFSKNLYPVYAKQLLAILISGTSEDLARIDAALHNRSILLDMFGSAEFIDELSSNPKLFDILSTHSEKLIIPSDYISLMRNTEPLSDKDIDLNARIVGIMLKNLIYYSGNELDATVNYLLDNPNLMLRVFADKDNAEAFARAANEKYDTFKKSKHKIKRPLDNPEVFVALSKHPAFRLTLASKHQGIMHDIFIKHINKLDLKMLLDYIGPNEPAYKAHNNKIISHLLSKSSMLAPKPFSTVSALQNIIDGYGKQFVYWIELNSNAELFNNSQMLRMALFSPVAKHSLDTDLNSPVYKLLDNHSATIKTVDEWLSLMQKTKVTGLESNEAPTTVSKILASANNLRIIALMLKNINSFDKEQLVEVVKFLAKNNAAYQAIATNKPELLVELRNAFIDLRSKLDSNSKQSRLRMPFRTKQPVTELPQIDLWLNVIDTLANSPLLPESAQEPKPAQATRTEPELTQAVPEQEVKPVKAAVTATEPAKYTVTEHEVKAELAVKTPEKASLAQVAEPGQKTKPKQAITKEQTYGLDSKPVITDKINQLQSGSAFEAFLAALNSESINLDEIKKEFMLALKDYYAEKLTDIIEMSINFKLAQAFNPEMIESYKSIKNRDNIEAFVNGMKSVAKGRSLLANIGIAGILNGLNVTTASIAPTRPQANSPAKAAFTPMATAAATTKQAKHAPETKSGGPSVSSLIAQREKAANQTNAKDKKPPTN